MINVMIKKNTPISMISSVSTLNPPFFKFFRYLSFDRGCL